MRRTIIVVGLVLGSIGCKDKSAAPAPAPTTASPVATDTAAATTVAKSGKMAHCPNAVEGATTVTKDVEGGIELTVTAKDPALLSDIRARTQAIVDASRTASLTKHNGNGGGGGPFGRCPIVLKDTTLDAQSVEGGSRITVKAKSADEVDWLRRETEERAERLRAPGSTGAGAGKMAHCPSAVDGAKTQITATKDGVSVTVLATGDGVTQVRDRAKTLARVSKHGEGVPRDGAHTGDGKGGGGLGRCPIVLKDTVVEEKDIEGGSQISVKAKTASSVATVQADAKERAAKFQLGTPGSN
jgi:hypothetical protein